VPFPRMLALALLSSALAFSVTSAHAAGANTGQDATAQTTTVMLEWTAPGDDSLSGTAYQYDLRWSMVPISPANFQNANPVSSVPVPAMAGTTQRVTLLGLPDLPTLYFAVRTCDERGNWSAISNVVTRSGGTVAVEDAAFALHFAPPMPNPARGMTRFSFALPTPAAVEVVAFDVQGRAVRTLMRESRPAGPSDLSWDLTDDSGRPLPGGVYFVKARLGTATFNRRVVIAK
jgi:hypothetical protein